MSIVGSSQSLFSSGMFKPRHQNEDPLNFFLNLLVTENIFC